ncbi:MAG: hypothetical protein GY772_29050, partial [bacterium]|nr:hypothetical protein [bacterium]
MGPALALPQLGTVPSGTALPPGEASAASSASGARALTSALAPAPPPAPGGDDPDASASQVGQQEDILPNPRVLRARRPPLATEVYRGLAGDRQIVPSGTVLSQYYVHGIIPPERTARAACLRALNTLALPGHHITELSDFRAFNWPLIMARITAPSTVLWNQFSEATQLFASTQDQAQYLMDLGFPGLTPVLRGNFQHFGAWVLDCAVVSIAIEMGLRSPTIAHECVSNATFAVLGGLDPWPVAATRPVHSPGQAEHMGNLFETFAGSLASAGAWDQLRRLGVTIAFVEYFDKL